MNMVSALKKPDHKQVLQRVSIHGGRGVAYLTRESDPDGGITEHLISASGRLIDVMFERQVITPTHHRAATMLRDAYERARISMSTMGAVDPERLGGSRGNIDFIRMREGVTLEDSDGEEAVLAGKEYRRVMRQLGQWWPVLRAVVIEDRDPKEYGKRYNCSGEGMLRAALDRLAKHFGLEAKARR